MVGTRWSWIARAACAAVLAGCSGDGGKAEGDARADTAATDTVAETEAADVPSDAPAGDALPAGAVSAKIGPEGGVIVLPGGGSVAVPEGALAEETTIVVTPTASPGGESFDPLGAFHVFEPHGLEFAVAVTVSLPLGADAAPASGALFGLAWRQPGDPWGLVSAELDAAGLLTASVYHFSEGGPAAWLPCETEEDCPTEGAPHCEGNWLVNFECGPETALCEAAQTDCAAEGRVCAGGACVEACPEGDPCDDADACTEGEACDASGACGGGAPVQCPDDGDPCSADSCDALLGCDAPAAAGTPCDDGDACTSDDACDGSFACAGEVPRECPDDGNECTQAQCDPAFGCFQPVPAGTPCYDGEVCTEDDVCDGAGGCGGAAVQCPPDGNPCTDDACDPNFECYYPVLEGAACDDGDPCTSGGVCSAAGECLEQPACDDGNVCTDETCLTDGTCVVALAEGAECAGSADCDDGNACTDYDLCEGCTCMHATSVVTVGDACDDGDPCTGGDVCSADGDCTGQPECDDGNACTDDACQSDGTCEYSLAPGAGCAADAECDDGNGCTDDACDACVCNHAYGNHAGQACDDTDPCTVQDTCGDIWCWGQPKCNDGNTCTDDACQLDGTCEYSLGPGAGCAADADCDDGNACTDDSCTGCVCEHETFANGGGSCDDGDPCTSGDTCSDAGDCAGQPACGDGNACTEDTCLPDGTCEHQIDDMAECASDADCDDDNPCTEDSCEWCNCVNDASYNEGSDCEDGDACTDGEFCEGGGCAGGSPVECPNDNDPCTVDQCDQALGCYVPAAPGTVCDDGNPCTSPGTCDAAGACQPGPQSACDDGFECTEDLCDPVTGACSHNPIPGANCGTCAWHDDCPNEGIAFCGPGDPQATYQYQCIKMSPTTKTCVLNTGKCLDEVIFGGYHPTYCVPVTGWGTLCGCNSDDQCPPDYCDGPTLQDRYCGPNKKCEAKSIGCASACGGCP